MRVSYKTCCGPAPRSRVFVKYFKSLMDGSVDQLVADRDSLIELCNTLTEHGQELDPDEFLQLITVLKSVALSDEELYASEFISPALCEMSLERVSETADVAFQIEVLSFIERLLASNPATFRQGLSNLGTLELVTGLFESDKAFASTMFNILGFFLIADEETSRSLVVAFFPQASDLSLSCEIPEVRESAFFFLWKALQHSLLDDEQLVVLTASLAANLQQQLPSPFIGSIAACLWIMGERYPVMIVRLAQPKIAAILGRYLFPLDAVPDEVVHSVLCVFQSYFYYPGPHLCWIESDANLFKRVIELAGLPRAGVQKAAVRLISVAVANSEGIWKMLVENAVLETLGGLARSDPEFRGKAEVSECLVHILAASDFWPEVVESQAVSSLLASPEALPDTTVELLAMAGECTARKAMIEGRIFAFREFLVEHDLLPLFEHLVQQLPELHFEGLEALLSDTPPSDEEVSCEAQNEVED
jgi:hypothetical protein